MKKSLSSVVLCILSLQVLEASDQAFQELCGIYDDAYFMNDALIVSFKEKRQPEDLEILKKMVKHPEFTHREVLGIIDEYYNGDLQNPFFKNLVAAGYSFEMRDGEGETVLTAACRDDDERFAFKLCGNRDLDVNRSGRKGLTPLMLLFLYNEKKLTTCWPDGRLLGLYSPRQEQLRSNLFERGVDLNVRDEDGNTVLTYAAMTQDSRDLVGLLKQGARADVVNKHGVTPLMVAAARGAFIWPLVEGGGNTNAKDCDGKSAVDYARAGAELRKKHRGSSADFAQEVVKAYELTQEYQTLGEEKYLAQKTPSEVRFFNSEIRASYHFCNFQCSYVYLYLLKLLEGKVSFVK